MKLRVYIVNLGKYGEDDYVGDWFTLPVSFSTVAERLNLNRDYEEYAIHKYEAPFKVCEYDSLRKLNRVAELMKFHTNNPVIKYSGELCEHLGIDILEFFETIDSVKVYFECKNWTDYARHLVDANVSFKGEEDMLVSNYINYDTLGRDLSCNPNLFQAKDGIIIDILPMK